MLHSECYTLRSYCEAWILTNSCIIMCQNCARCKSLPKRVYVCCPGPGFGGGGIIGGGSGPLGNCFADLIDNECRNAMSQRLSVVDCCCTASGKGWSEARVCQLCPLRNTGTLWLRLYIFIAAQLTQDTHSMLFTCAGQLGRSGKQ